MKYLKNHNSFINENLSLNFDYFKKIFLELKLDKDKIIKNRDEIIEKLIDRATLNLDNNPSDVKILDWKFTINKVIDKFIDTNGEFTPEKGEFNYIDPIQKYNEEMLHKYCIKGLKCFDEILSIPDYYVKEVGYETVIDFLKSDEETTFHDKYPKINIKRYAEEDELDYILRKDKTESNWALIKNKLIYHFCKRMMANIPDDKKFENEDDVYHFLMVYIEKFLHQYLIPMSKLL